MINTVIAIMCATSMLVQSSYVWEIGHFYSPYHTTWAPKEHSRYLHTSWTLQIIIKHIFFKHPCKGSQKRLSMTFCKKLISPCFIFAILVASPERQFSIPIGTFSKFGVPSWNPQKLSETKTNFKYLLFVGKILMLVTPYDLTKCFMDWALRAHILEWGWKAH